MLNLGFFLRFFENRAPGGCACIPPLCTIVYTCVRRGFAAAEDDDDDDL